MKALRAYVSGDPFGAPPFLDKPIYMRPAQRSYTSLAYILPSKEFWQPDEVSPGSVTFEINHFIVELNQLSSGKLLLTLFVWQNWYVSSKGDISVTMAA